MSLCPDIQTSLSGVPESAQPVYSHKVYTQNGVWGSLYYTLKVEMLLTLKGFFLQNALSNDLVPLRIELVIVESLCRLLCRLARMSLDPESGIKMSEINGSLLLFSSLVSINRPLFTPFFTDMQKTHHRMC